MEGVAKGEMKGGYVWEVEGCQCMGGRCLNNIINVLIGRETLFRTLTNFCICPKCLVKFKGVL